MCYAGSCNPACGKCRPRRILEVACPACGEQNQITREEYLLVTRMPHEPNIIERKLLERGRVEPPRCSRCGAELLKAYQEKYPPLPCTKCNIICGFPCGQRVTPYDPATSRCPAKVPLALLDEE